MYKTNYFPDLSAQKLDLYIIYQNGMINFFYSQGTTDGVIASETSKASQVSSSLIGCPIYAALCHI